MVRERETGEFAQLRGPVVRCPVTMWQRRWQDTEHERSMTPSPAPVVCALSATRIRTQE